MKKPPPDWHAPGKPVPAIHIGAVFGITERAVRELGRRGIIPKAGDNLYPIRASVRAYCNYLREAAAGRGGTGVIGHVSRHRARLVKEQADKAELQNRVARRELVPLAEVEADWIRKLVAFRNRLLALPSRVQQRLPSLTAADVRQIDQEVRETLTELADGHAEAPAMPEMPRRKSSRAA